ncbi:MAG TPA: hypothetical protein VNJ28_04660 [Candidatus Limnocylindrales bacterium]|nr:hypothetical protein [Candidatus Limnocylindrales bacterium]
MAREVRAIAVTIPAGTTPAAPHVVTVDLGPRIVRAVRLRFPPGPSGKVGIALGSAGVRVIPWGPSEWLVADDEAIEWPLEGQISSGRWEVSGYNVGVFPHTIYVAWLLDPAQAEAPVHVLRPPLQIAAAG